MSVLRHVRCLPTALRLAVLVLLALGVMAKPVLAAVGEVHELQHDPSGLHLHHGDAEGEGNHAGAGSESMTAQPGLAPHAPGDGGLLHDLLHFAHCCGQSPPTVPMAAMTLPGPVAASTPSAIDSAPAPTHRTHGVFRPPIQE